MSREYLAIAKHAMSLDGGGRVEKGDTVTLRSTETGIRALSLFSSPKRRETASRQFAAQGLVGIKPQHLNTGSWDLKEIKR